MCLEAMGAERGGSVGVRSAEVVCGGARNGAEILPKDRVVHVAAAVKLDRSLCAEVMRAHVAKWLHVAKIYERRWHAQSAGACEETEAICVYTSCG